ncbi:sn-glycerol-3-phosphate ABC transporter ATP-binding protein UgpC [Fodinicurvata sp. EGI_FJ10296]|uniref:ABC transporter ATP-binding protein n=1 Tax=Fodinicurvata sp. EGI_FJ10296 TaxID=3231908 RepID=UPI0034558077
MARIELEEVVKMYGDLEAIHRVSLDIQDHEFMVFVGPSGCGKSTLLRMIAGLETISDGEIRIGGKGVNALEPRYRDIAMVFQDYALYPHMTVRDNLIFGLKIRGASAAEKDDRLKEVADILQIGELLDRKPGQLSGGQRQRVAMGRAIVRRPSAFLFDEPLSNLDAKLRVDMRMQIKRLHSLLSTTTVYVTHDQVEAMTLADRITVLRDGYIEQVGTPAELYANPVNLFVAEFIGSPSMNFFDATYVNEGGKAEIVAGDGLRFPSTIGGRRNGSPVVVGIRPEHLEPPRFGEADQPIQCNAKAVLLEPLGSDTMALCQTHGLDIMARLTPGRVSGPGDQVDLTIDPRQVHLFDPANGMRLTAESSV